jgi:hypothetical protein
MALTDQTRPPAIQFIEGTLIVLIVALVVVNAGLFAGVLDKVSDAFQRGMNAFLGPLGARGPQRTGTAAGQEQPAPAGQDRQGATETPELQPAPHELPFTAWPPPKGVRQQ